MTKTFCDLCEKQVEEGMGRNLNNIPEHQRYYGKYELQITVTINKDLCRSCLIEKITKGPLSNKNLLREDQD